MPNKKRCADSPRYKSLSFLRRLTLFSDLATDDLTLFLDEAQIKPYLKGQMLYIEGEPAEHFYLICSGWVKLSRTTAEGEEVILAMLTSESITGENALFENRLYASSYDAKQTLHATDSGLHQAANQAGRKASGMFNTASDEIVHASEKVTEEIRSSPVRSSVIALSMGVALGLLLRR